MTFINCVICHQIASLRKLYSVTLTYFSMVKDSKRPSHRSERHFKCDECECRCTQSSSIARFELTHSSKRPFKFGECEFKCK